MNSRIYFQDEWSTIYHGDCREVLPLLPKVDLVLTDPPYGTGWVRGGGSVGKFNAVHERPAWDVWDAAWNAATRADKRAIFCPLNRAASLDPSAILYYRKTNPRPGGPSREAIAVTPAPWGMDKWEYAAYNGDCQLHPCQKPLELLLWLMRGMSDAGDLVLDPFMGSGTTLVAAKRLGRKAIGIEIEERYCEIAVRRLSQGVLDFQAEGPAPEALAPVTQDSLFEQDPGERLRP